MIRSVCIPVRNRFCLLPEHSVYALFQAVVVRPKAGLPELPGRVLPVNQAGDANLSAKIIHF